MGIKSIAEFVVAVIQNSWSAYIRLWALSVD